MRPTDRRTEPNRTEPAPMALTDDEARRALASLARTARAVARSTGHDPIDLASDVLSTLALAAPGTDRRNALASLARPVVTDEARRHALATARGVARQIAYRNRATTSPEPAPEPAPIGLPVTTFTGDRGWQVNRTGEAIAYLFQPMARPEPSPGPAHSHLPIIPGDHANYLARRAEWRGEREAAIATDGNVNRPDKHLNTGNRSLLIGSLTTAAATGAITGTGASAVAKVRHPSPVRERDTLARIQSKRGAAVVPVREMIRETSLERLLASDLRYHSAFTHTDRIPENMIGRAIREHLARPGAIDVAATPRERVIGARSVALYGSIGAALMAHLDVTDGRPVAAKDDPSNLVGRRFADEASRATARGERSVIRATDLLRSLSLPDDRPNRRAVLTLAARVASEAIARTDLGALPLSLARQPIDVPTGDHRSEQNGPGDRAPGSPVAYRDMSGAIAPVPVRSGRPVRSARGPVAHRLSRVPVAPVPVPVRLIGSDRFGSPVVVNADHALLISSALARFARSGA